MHLEGRMGWGGKEGLLFSATHSIRSFEREPWMERKKHVKQLVKMKYRYVRLELLDYLKYYFKKIPRTWFFPLLPTFRYFFYTSGVLYSKIASRCSEVFSLSHFPVAFLFSPGERYHRDQCQRALLKTLTQKAHSRPLEASASQMSSWGTSPDVSIEIPFRRQTLTPGAKGHLNKEPDWQWGSKWGYKN